MSSSIGVTAAAVKNVLKRKIKLTYAAQATWFEPGEVKIVSEGACNHALMQQHGETTQVEVQKGVFQGQVIVVRPFKRVPLDEAIKSGIKIDEDPALQATAKNAADALEARKKERKEWEDDFKKSFLSDLKAQGLQIVPTGDASKAGAQEGAAKK